MDLQQFKSEVIKFIEKTIVGISLDTPSLEILNSDPLELCAEVIFNTRPNDEWIVPIRLYNDVPIIADDSYIFKCELTEKGLLKWLWKDAIKIIDNYRSLLKSYEVILTDRKKYGRK